MVRTSEDFMRRGTVKARVVVYERDAETIDFLRSFFTKRRGLQAEFANTPASLAKAFAGHDCNCLCIVPADELGKIAIPEDVSVIATIQGNSTDGILHARKHGANNYLMKPLLKEDLDFKIKDIAGRREMLEHLRKDTSNLRAIIDLTYLVTSTFNPQEILYLIVKKISEVIPVTRCSIIRIDDNRRFASVVSTFEDPKLRSMRLDLNKYPEIRKALTSKKPVVIDDVTVDPLMERVRDVLFPLGIRAIVVVPIVFHEEVIGTLFLRTSRAQSSFTEDEIRLCAAIANVSANALHNAFLFERMEDEKARLEKLAITDFLTGAFNIRYFYHRLTEEFSRSRRYGLPLSCLMIDIDHFKKINDKFGHRVGDGVLREFAQFLRKHTRKSDVLARYGGEEFIMLLTQTSAEGAYAKAETLRSTVREHHFKGLKGSRRLTISIGIATSPHPLIKNEDGLISFADNALYDAKHSGRNRVAAHKP